MFLLLKRDDPAFPLQSVNNLLFVFVHSWLSEEIKVQVKVRMVVWLFRILSQSLCVRDVGNVALEYACF